ncbi:MAG: DUF1343 domain-containing protein [Verrucomicrobia bacterium]|nr:DUF1343 domain-containing protein [Verrucomicrobiota bacterium]
MTIRFTILIATLICFSAGLSKAQKSAGSRQPVLNGIDYLVEKNFTPLAGLRIGLITNQTGIDRQRRSNIDLLADSPEVNLVALFSPEHGIRGKLDTSKIDDSRDSKTGLPVYSLYKNKIRKPSAKQLNNIDALVFDIQDIGCRFYTYISTMGLCMEAAADDGIKFIVLDRVNPIGGEQTDGPIRIGPSKFVAYHDIAIQHGMTIGELAKMINAERKLNTDLTIVPIKNWKRRQLFDSTGLPWVNPSPNIRNLTQAILYPGVGLVEFTELSVGRGTDTPFEIVGAPYINGEQLAQILNSQQLPGVKFTSLSFTPKSSMFAKQKCGGVKITLTHRQTYRSLDTGLIIARTLLKLYPKKFDPKHKLNTLLLHPPTLKALSAQQSLSDIRKHWQPDLKKFIKRRKPYLIYP